MPRDHPRPSSHDHRDLLEREAELAALAAAVDRARSDSGSVILVMGEAGVGKTSLIRAHLAALPPDVRVMTGAAEDLVSARALGPFREMFPAGVDLADADRVVSRLLADVHDGPGPVVVVIDDAHWADDASLDVVRSLSRRVHALPLVVVLALRHAELTVDHPLRRLLATLTGPNTRRLELTGLSPAGVDVLAAQAGVDPSRLADLEGNPFLVTEILAAPDADLPATVRDAIVGRLGSLSPDERDLLCTLAVFPRAAEIDVLTDLFPDAAELLETPERGGLVRLVGSRVTFRHEIARRAVESTLPETGRLVRHRHVLQVLEKRGADPSVLLHHAVGGADAASIARHAPEAARVASLARAHREALAASRFALEHPDYLDRREVATLHGIAARAAYMLNRHPEAADHANHAVATWSSIDPSAPETGHALLLSARMQTMVGNPAESENLALTARNVLTPHGPSAALAEVYEKLANIQSVAGENADAIINSHAAIEVARQVEAPLVAARASIHLGLALAGSGDPAATSTLERAVDDLHRLGDPEFEARGASNLAVVLIWQGRHPEALPHLDRVDRIARIHGLDQARYHCAATRANVEIFVGEWETAEARLRGLLSDDGGGAMRVLPMAFLGGLLLRKGDAEADELIDSAYHLAATSGQIRRIGPAGAARLERAWFAGDVEQATTLADSLIDVAVRGYLVHLRGMIARTLKRLGAPVTVFDGCPEGYAAGIVGDWSTAAAAWERVGNPYEQALELIEAPDPATAVAGIGILDRLGARRTATVARRLLRSRGVVRIPRQRPATVGVDRLTPRQTEILDLIARGLHSPEIAAQLHLSRRTVDNHVAAILTALDVTSRKAAVAAVREQAGRPE